MNTSNQITRPALIIAMMLLAAFSRLLPHWPNFTAVMAVALFGGAKFKNSALAVIIPLVVMLLTGLTSSTMHFGGTEVEMGFHSLMPLVYGCIAATALLGIYIRKKAKAGYIVGASVISSTLFFLVTNAGVWYHNPEFAQDVNGLFQCYDLGLPFYGNQLFGDLFFNGLLFGTFALAQRKFSVLVKA